MSEDNLVSFRLSEDLRELVEEQAERDDVSFSAKVREYCREGVDGLPDQAELPTDK